MTDTSKDGSAGDVVGPPDSEAEASRRSMGLGVACNRDESNDNFRDVAAWRVEFLRTDRLWRQNFDGIGGAVGGKHETVSFTRVSRDDKSFLFAADAHFHGDDPTSRPKALVVIPEAVVPLAAQNPSNRANEKSL